MNEPMPGIDRLIKAVLEADERGQSSYVFEVLPEAFLWPQIQVLLKDSEQWASCGPTLLQGIGLALPRLQDHGSVLNVLLQALEPTQDALAFYEAQRAVLAHATRWEPTTTHRFYDAFENCYRNNSSEVDLFVRELALEGAVMLPLCRGDDELLYSAVGLLLNSFPEAPANASDPASLTVKAVKLLGRCYDRLPGSAPIARRLKAIAGTSNWKAANEARVGLGIVFLYDAFRSSTQSTFLAAMRTAQSYFSQAAEVEEGRTDAELLSAVARCYLLALERGPSQAVSDVVREAQQILAERLLAFGGGASVVSLPGVNIEPRLVQLMIQLGRWREQLSHAAGYSLSSPRIQVLAQAYAAVREAQATEGFISDVGRTTHSLVLLEQVTGQFPKNHDIEVALAEVLADPSWVAATPAYEADFYRLVLRVLRDSAGPKDEAAPELERIRAAAESKDPEFAELIARVQASGKSDKEKLIELSEQWWEDRRTREGLTVHMDLRASENAQRIIRELDEHLGWERSSEKRVYLEQAVRISAQYHYNLYTIDVAKASPTRNVAFLFADDSGVYGGKGGLGKKAVESHLEGDFYNTTRNSPWASVIERQAGTVVPGRSDLLFRFPSPDPVIFPIEVKAEGADVGRENVRSSYVAQAQAYGMLRVSFLFILDTTPKPKSLPLKNVADYCYVDRVSVPGEVETNHVIVFIFPANRYLPYMFSK